ncbi:hypothetical protein N8E89_08640 [Phyllobacterium sp. A18/5-2]|jgi:hypothetical protein|uniref:hypothetical protein n=1 Tax=Phyllobacterium sp. A18/5-2 TaxID=2978392 RepID=UPI000DDFF500|nr:hypothetical protein [Phyllobacterium sp. A18/5-2]UXN65644.1 hypothetical protein N8E89_08640 [Phyllobacterium sp. A18/5-2]
MRKTWNDWRLAVRMLCALALVFVAFAHQPIEAGTGGQIDLAAYTLPDGTVPVLCLPGSGDKDLHTSSWHGTGCEACRLSGSFILPAPASTAGPKVQPARSLAIKREAILIARSLYPPSAPPQAPPLA